MCVCLVGEGDGADLQCNRLINGMPAGRICSATCTCSHQLMPAATQGELAATRAELESSERARQELGAEATAKAAALTKLENEVALQAAKHKGELAAAKGEGVCGGGCGRCGGALVQQSS